jgi:PAS domain S-box-containing protein
MTEPFRLFLVEDDEEVAFLTRLHLERAGYQVTACRTAADAFIVLSHNPYHLVLLDDRLPDMRGLEFLQTLAREGIRTPVLMMTACGNEKVATQALQAGALDYVVKDEACAFLAELPKRVQESVTRHRLQQSNQLLIAGLESARDGICITDLQGTMLHVNKALETMTGFGRQELVGHNPRLFKSGAHASSFYAELWRTILARQSWQGEMLNRRKDGTLLDTSLTISPIVDSRGQLTHFVGIYRDTRERKQLERQLLQAQKMQSLGTLAGGIAHEFNNLLAGIQGYAALGLREPGSTPRLQEFLQFIIELSERAANLTRQLLAFARMPALTSKPTRMAELVRATAELIRRSLCVEVAVEIPAADDDGELQAMADANQLQQVLINLALNARDAMTGSKPILFRLQHLVLTGEFPAFPQSVPAGDYVVLRVQDQGRGMPPEVLNQALDPFFTTKELGQGTGLGLPVAFGIIHGHQGFLTLDSQPASGTSVCLYLPRLTGLSPAAGSAAGVDGHVLEPEQMLARDILVVDDEQAVLDVVRRFLEIAGHRVTCVTTGTEALQVLAGATRFDLVILDLMIPREDGAATFQLLRQRWPALPILLCTGLLESDPGTPSFEGEQVQVLRKPFRINELWFAVNQALNGPEGR